MKNDNFKKCLELMKKANVLVRNSEISDLISNNIYRYINSKKSKIDVNENHFSGMIKNSGEDFYVVFSPSIDDCSHVFITYHDFGGRCEVKRSIFFDDAFTTVVKTDNNEIIRSDTKEFSSIERNDSKAIYYNNDLIYKKDLQVELDKDINREPITKASESYILPNGTFASKKIVINFYNSSIKYYETDSFCDARFDDKDQKEKLFMYGISESTSEHFLDVSKKVNELINQKENVKLKK